MGRIFLGLKFSTPVFCWVEDLTVYFFFFWSKKPAHIFLGSNSARLMVAIYKPQKKNILSFYVPKLVNLDHQTLFLFQQKGKMYTVLKIAFLGYKSLFFFWV